MIGLVTWEYYNKSSRKGDSAQAHTQDCDTIQWL